MRWKNEMLYKLLPIMQLIIWRLADFLSLGTLPYSGPFVLRIARI
jgi:hypothetical protein